MDINVLRCPNCAGMLENDIEHGKKTCPFCGGEYYIVSSERQSAVSSEEMVDISEVKDKLYKIKMIRVGPNKVKAIKVYRELTGLGLKETKDAIDIEPNIIFEGLSKAEADDIRSKMESEASGIVLEVVE